MNKLKILILLVLLLNLVVYAKPQANLKHEKNSSKKSISLKKHFKSQFKNQKRFRKRLFTNENSSSENEDNSSVCEDTPNSLIIPLYSYDEELWDKVINLDAYNVVAIVNPNSGVGDSPDPFYQDVINRLVENGKTPIGYVHTSYGDRDINEVKAEIDTWLEYYPNIKGFFLDETSSSAEDYPYYEELYAYIKSKGGYLVFLNAGTYPDEEYFNIADNIVIYENNPSYFDKSLCDLHPDKSSFIIYNADEETMADLMEDTSCSYKYITDDDLPNPYDLLPSYIDEEAEKSKGICY